MLAVIIAGQDFISLKHECRVMLQRGDSRNLLFILCFFYQKCAVYLVVLWS